MVGFGSAYAENAESGYSYQTVTPRPDLYPRYQWRPRENNQPQVENDVTTYPGSVEPRQGSTQSSMAWPSASYRPREVQKSMPSYSGGFKFRTLSPGGGSRLGGTQPAGENEKPHGYLARPKFRDSDNDEKQSVSGIKKKFRFRPDKRFSRTGGEYNSTYSINSAQDTPPIYATPVFRQDNRER